MGLDFKKSYHDLLQLWGAESKPPASGTSGSGTGTYGTGNGGIQLPTRRLRPKEFRKLLEAFYEDCQRLPKDADEFERWLSS